jgi:hypothetical protein
MTRARLAHLERVESERQGNLSLWIGFTYSKNRRALRLEVQAKARRRREDKGCNEK